MFKSQIKSFINFICYAIKIEINNIHNQLKFISSVDISKLKSKVLANGWEWIELNEEATKLVEENAKKVQNKS